MPKGSLHALGPLVSSFVLLAAVAVVTALLVWQQEREAAAVAKAMQVRGGLIELFSALQDTETGQRGFLLKGERAYLSPFLEGSKVIDARFKALHAAYADDTRSLDRLAELKSVTDQKLGELQRTIDLKAAGDAKHALDIFGSDSGLRLMDRARAIVAELRDDNVRRMLARQARVKRVGRLVEISVVLAILAAMAAAAFVLNDARRRETRLVATVKERDAAARALAAAAERRERVEGQLRQAQKMEAVGQLTGGLAHDFNNMLSIVIGSLTMMRRRIQRGEMKLESYVELAIDGAERATNLTHRLLAFARRQPLAPEVLQLNKILPGLSELLRRTLGETIRLETVLGGGLWYTSVDANQLESAIVNLAVNARDAMPDGGNLTVETANAHLDDAYAAKHVEVRPGQYVMLAISDSGMGMTAEVLRQAFDPFFTTKGVGKGSGLGLSQVYGFVKQSGGHVKIYSEPGHGTTVRIYLPRSYEAAASADPMQQRGDLAELPLGEPRQIILVVEDEDGVRRLTVEALRDLNYSVLHAGSGAEALQIFERNQGIALLLTDVVMPQITGKQLVDQARALRPDLKALYMTGYTRNSIVHNGIIDPDVQLISKPFTLEQLASKVQACITSS